ncbi:response regulator transcription factor [[Phormidium ambiguum] IAM M-71]|uniref:response regulator transcription factor n=1 Tax=[Phormidium ambiguum] IAM M-71 TaxID=454136 RepID=UPI000A0599A0|nr:response regulator transcription factor [Phormidium ambiguum]
MASVSVQIVESNPHLRSLLGWHLQQVGYRVYQAASLYQAREVFQLRQPTLVILDAELPDGDGLEFCRWLLRQQQPYILMLSARNTEADIVAGLKAGADDYLTKPFGMQEFLARIEALIRRNRMNIPPAYLDYGDLKIDLVQRRVRFQEELIDLTPQEFSLLYVLAQAGGQPLSRSELLNKAWPDAIDNPRTIDTHVLSLRKKLETDPRQPSIIQTIRNVGYRFNPEFLNSYHSQSHNSQNHGGEEPRNRSVPNHSFNGTNEPRNHELTQPTATASQALPISK